ncbi:MAG TPA: septal ring lytic transglycosylase RlpA family protein [Aliidongia sp.]|nr:septal ring lytic transglycosylase RlpA family protein [Aliidongia sp.]
MIGFRFFSAFACLAAGLLLNGCASHPPPPSGGGETHAQHNYKVGQPYQINGVWYYPSDDLNYDETGIASWYGPDFHEKYTANGEVFDQNAISAAHKTLPLPSIAQVTNLDNGRMIEVRINDRGPFVGNRIIDMSRRAAQLLGFEQNGTAKVRVRILVPESIQAASLAKAGHPEIAVETPNAAPRGAVTAEALPAPTPRNGSPAPVPLPLPQPQHSPTPENGPMLLPETVAVVPVKLSRIYIQAGAYASGTNAIRMKALLDPLGPVIVAGARVNGMDIYRVRLGPIATVDEADQLLNRAVGVGATDAKIVVDSQS